MNRTFWITATMLFLVSFTKAPTQAESIGGPGGSWPASWPKELEPLREQAWTWESGIVANVEYHLSFTSREQFETAWPHIVSLHAKGTPIALRRGPQVQVWKTKPPKNQTAGVILAQVVDRSVPDKLEEMQIVLVVDGKIVDLNRIALPPNITVKDERFSKAKPSP